MFNCHELSLTHPIVFWASFWESTKELSLIFFCLLTYIILQCLSATLFISSLSWYGGVLGGTSSTYAELIAWTGKGKGWRTERQDLLISKSSMCRTCNIWERRALMPRKKRTRARHFVFKPANAAAAECYGEKPHALRHEHLLHCTDNHSSGAHTRTPTEAPA